MYKLIDETSKQRVYRSEVTGTEVTTFLLKTDENDQHWWAFQDLLQMPFIRKKAAEKVTQLYGTYTTPEDINKITAALKLHLKSSDPEKYEKAYAEVLNLESLVRETADPNRQSLSLCSVYILADNERIDNFSFNEATEKMAKWTLMPDLQSFFLNWLNGGISGLTNLYATASKIALGETRESPLESESIKG